MVDTNKTTGPLSERERDLLDGLTAVWGCASPAKTAVMAKTSRRTTNGLSVIRSDPNV